MISQVDVQSITLMVLFTFCQVIGTTCALPDLSVAEGPTLLVEEGMACPMDRTTMCPPSLTSSPERQIKHILVLDFDHPMIVVSSANVGTVQSAPPPWCWSSASSVVPISIRSSSVLRI